MKINLKVDRGALGNNTDEGALIQTAIDDVAAAGGGEVYFGASSPRYSSSLLLELKDKVSLVGDGIDATFLRGTNAAGVLRMGQGAAIASGLEIRGLTLENQAGGGPILTFGTFSISKVEYSRVRFRGIATNQSLIKMQSDSAGCYDSEWNNCWLFRTSDPANVPAVDIVQVGNRFQSNSFRKSRCEESNAATAGAYFFHLESNGSQAYAAGNAFRDINFEKCDSGAMKLLGVRDMVIENCVGFDNVTTRAHLLDIGDNTLGGGSRGVVIIGFSRRSGVAGTGVYDVNIGANSTGVTIVNPGAGTSSTINLNGTITTVIGRQDSLTMVSAQNVLRPRSIAEMQTELYPPTNWG